MGGREEGRGDGREEERKERWEGGRNEGGWKGERGKVGKKGGGMDG